MGDYTRTERAARLRARMLADGLKGASIWAPEQDLDALRAAYPGPRGGIDWPKIIRLALSQGGLAANQPDSRDADESGEVDLMTTQPNP